MWQAHPLHLWDAVSGQLRATYRAYDAVDEVTAAYSVAFSRDGTRMLGGYNKAIRIFDTSRPGRFYTEIVTHSKKSHGLQGAPGQAYIITGTYNHLLACICPAPCTCGGLTAEVLTLICWWRSLEIWWRICRFELCLQELCRAWRAMMTALV